MQTTTVIICTVLIMLVIMFFVQAMRTPPKQGKGIDVHIDEHSGVHIQQSAEGIRLDIVYEASDDRPVYRSDEPIFPDIVNDVDLDGGANRDFWDEVAQLDILPIDRREDIISRLADYGFIRREDMKEMLIKEDDEPAQDEEPVPEPDPENEREYEREYPRTREDIELPPDSDLTEFNL